MAAAWLTVPNVITFARLAVAPVFWYLALTGQHRAALIVFVSAMASDTVDGLLARLLNQRSKLGAVLDPIADKLLVFSAVVTLTLAERLPLWLLGLLAFRDGAMVVGAVVVKRKRLEIPTAPTRIGKYATFASTCLVVLALTGLWAQSPTLDAYTAVVGFVAAICVAVSTIQYFARFGYLFTAPARSRSSPDERKESSPSRPRRR